MHVKSRQVAFTGALMALGVLLVTLGGYFEGSTLFFLAAASFLSGILFRGISPGTSVLFVVGTTVLGIFLAPQKLYLATFLGFSIYVLIAEFLERIHSGKEGAFGRGKIWAIKAVVYHALLFVAVFLVQKLFGMEALFDQGIYEYLQEFKVPACVLLVLAAELVWLIFDKAYFYFQDRYGKMFCRFLQD